MDHKVPMVADGGICISGAAAGERSGTGVRAILTMPSLSGDPLQRKKGSCVSSQTSYCCPINRGNGFLNEATAATGLTVKLSANLNYLPRAPCETHTRVLVPVILCYQTPSFKNK